MSSQLDLLSYVRKKLTVDIDSMDPLVALRHTNLDRFCDMTSNQAIVHGEITRPERHQILEAVLQAIDIDYIHGSEDAILLQALDLATVLLAKEVFPSLTGRVHAQTSPSVAYNTDQTVLHAKRLVSLFATHGIPSSRVCIKIPATPESIIACQQLEQEGIRTLATCLFSVSQALAASQAGCLYVAPYFNELRVHFKPDLWKEYKDTSREHPMSPVISDIITALKETNSKTLVMPASIVTASEVMALVSLQPDHLTLSGSVLDALASSPFQKETSKSDIPQLREKVFQHTGVGLQTSSAQPEAKGQNSPDLDRTDFLLDDGDALRKAIASDTETERKLSDALLIFGEMEQKAKDFLRNSSRK